MLNASAYPALVLNADFRPLTLAPLRSWTWEHAVKAAYAGRVVVVDEYERRLRSPGSASRAAIELALPSVVALRDYVSLDRPAAFTRAGLFLRDGRRCAYCGERKSTRDLTFDHVHPQSMGGRTDWMNVVAACAPCNGRKGSRTLKEAGLTLLNRLYAPTCAQMNAIVQRQGFEGRRMPAPWLPWLGIEATTAVPAGIDQNGTGVFPDGMTSGDYWFEPIDP